MSDDAGRISEDGIERRRFLKGAATVAWATPLILTMTAHAAGAQAISCLPNGGPCDACEGMNCCDADGPADGGCCCSDANAAGCGGVCVAVDADCANFNVTPANNFICWTPTPVTPPGTLSVGRSRSTGKSAKPRL